MSLSTDVRPTAATLYFLPVRTRMPLKFGPETTTQVTCARVCLRVQDGQGRRATGWGETPLSVQWVWPSALSYEARHACLKNFCVRLAGAWANHEDSGHPLEVGARFIETVLQREWKQAGQMSQLPEPMPWLAALVCCSAFDLALHDAYGNLHRVRTWDTYCKEFMNLDLSHFLEPDGLIAHGFQSQYPAQYILGTPPQSLPAWHLVGGLDPLGPEELTGHEPQDGYPVLLADWIKADGLKCLKIKLRGNDAAWDYQRLVRVGRIGAEHGVGWLTADFNCTVQSPEYVNDILDRLMRDHPSIFQQLLYVEQPFPYDLEAHPIAVHSVSQRKPLFLDESAHDWRVVRSGRKLGWTGVALKTCKTQTGAVLAMCWAKAHGMSLMVQDLTNPMLAQIPHVLLAAHAGTIMGVETNASQFYPEASRVEATVHPGLYKRQQGCVELSSIRGPGFGYRLDEIQRSLPSPAFES